MKLIFDEQGLFSYIQILQSAKRRIYMCCFKLTYPKKKKLLGTDTIIENIINGWHRKVEVKILLHHRSPFDEVSIRNKEAVRLITRENIPIRHLRNNRICHAKFLIVDSTTAILGSHNISMSSMRRNFESSILFTDKLIIEELERKFEDVYRTAEKF